MYSYIYMYYTLKTKTIKFKTQNISIDNIKRALISCYSNISFSTIPYLLYNYNSIQTLKIMNSGNCIAMSMFLKKYLNDNYKIKSYLIPASIPKLYQDSRFLDLSHVALVIPINENEAYICDVAFYFLSPIKIKLQHNHVNESIENVGVYDNTVNTVNSKMEYNKDAITLNDYQKIKENTYTCVCHYTDDHSDIWKYYLTEITNPDQSIGTTFIQCKTNPFICTTKIRNGKCVMDMYLKYISDSEILLQHNYKNLYIGSMLNVPDYLMQFMNRKLYKYLKTDIQSIFRRPINKKLVLT